MDNKKGDRFLDFKDALIKYGISNLPEEEDTYYEEDLMCDVYSLFEEKWGIELVPSTQCGMGSVDVYRDGRWISSYDFETETERMLEAAIEEEDYADFIRRATEIICDLAHIVIIEEGPERKED
jgi:hypothetical protein